MAEDNKITIDVKINTDGQNQINQYVNAFDDLRKSVNSLSQPISAISSTINTLDRNLSKYTDSLSKLNEQQQETASASEKAGEKVSILSNTFSSITTILQAAQIELRALGVALTGGLSIVIAFLPELIKFATYIFKGSTAINAMVENLKNMNAVMKDANKDAAAETTRLQILYRSATDANNATEARIKSVQQLKKEYPNHLKNISDENIMNGNSKKIIDGLTKSITDNAKAKAALSKITEQANTILDAEYQIQKIQNANYNEIARGKKQMDGSRPGGRGAGGTNLKATLNQYIKDSNERATVAIDEQNKIKANAEQAIKFLEKYAGGANGIAAAITNGNEIIVANAKHNRAYYEAELAKHQALLDDLDANDKKFEATAKSIRKKIASDSKMLEAYSAPAPKVSRSVEKTSRPATEALEAKSIDFAQTIELDKQNYQTELALLDNQLKTKQITEEVYQQQSEQLQDKYHLAIGERIKVFNQTELADAQKHMEDLFTIQQHDDTMAKDEKAIKKAILPGDKLEAEKNLVADKYNYEIALAAGNTEKIKQLEEQKQQDISAISKRYEQERKAFAMETAQKVSDTAFSMLKGSIQSQADAKIKSLETQKQAELSNSSLTATQKKAIEEKYKKKEAEEKVKAFKAEQRASILQAVINGALAITKATAQTGVLAPFVIPGIIVSTALQVATIAKQKAPQYAKGGLHYQSDGRGALLSGYSRIDDTNAYLRSGEAVVVSEAMRNPWARNLVSAINVAHGGRDFSVGNPGRGYAIGGIFTDGGNANRYYSQPANDAKDLANTLAYQMINNFPPIYVDVKDVNNQQNILAQTVNRVNL